MSQSGAQRTSHSTVYRRPGRPQRRSALRRRTSSQRCRAQTRAQWLEGALQTFGLLSLQHHHRQYSLLSVRRMYSHAELHVGHVKLLACRLTTCNAWLSDSACMLCIAGMAVGSRHGYECQWAYCCSLRDMLYRRRMERQLAQARGLMSGSDKMPPPEDDVSLLAGSHCSHLPHEHAATYISRLLPRCCAATASHLLEPSPCAAGAQGCQERNHALFACKCNESIVRSRSFAQSGVKVPSWRTQGGEGGLPQAGSKPGGYVPPSKRGGAGGGEGDSMRRREENSVRVTNLSEDTREDDLRVMLLIRPHVSASSPQKLCPGCACRYVALVQACTLLEWQLCALLLLQAMELLHLLAAVFSCPVKSMHCLLCLVVWTAALMATYFCRSSSSPLDPSPASTSLMIGRLARAEALLSSTSCTERTLRALWSAWMAMDTTTSSCVWSLPRLGNSALETCTLLPHKFCLELESHG